jgi:glycosyltransferase involved in cell wall biosynthesis
MANKRPATKICHITTVHPLFDVRIFHRECKTLVQQGFDVALIARHEGDVVVEGVRVLGLPTPKNRLSRMVLLTLKAFLRALKENAAVYHFHDPELLLVGLALRCLGKRVVYDVHEDVPRDILEKEWIPETVRRPIAKIIEVLENWAARRMSSLVTVTPYILERFLRLRCSAIDVRNYPLLAELYAPGAPWREKERVVCYVGSICGFRGLFDMVNAIEKTDGRLLLAGSFSIEAEKGQAKRLQGWRHVEELGQIDRPEVRRTLARSMAGLAVIHPNLNLVNGLLVKIFEYMAAGIPVVTSHFPLWREIVEGNNCGVCVDPLNPFAIAEAVQWLFDHPAEAEAMGRRGRQAVEEQYNWSSESRKLIALYDRLLSGVNEGGL